MRLDLDPVLDLENAELRAALQRANALYLEHGLGARNDALAMQYLIPGWQFDAKRPCMVR